MEDAIGPNACYCFTSRKSSRWITRLYDAALVPSGLTISQYSILTVLEHHGRMKVSEMAGYMVMERTTLVRSLKPLIKDSIVLSSQQIGDRARHFELSEFGKAKLKDASPLWLSAQRQFEKSVQRVRALEFRDYHLAIPDGG